MFLAHFSGWDKGDIEAMTFKELVMWHKEALKLHNQINNPSPE